MSLSNNNVSLFIVNRDGVQDGWDNPLCNNYGCRTQLDNTVSFYTQQFMKTPAFHDARRMMQLQDNESVEIVFSNFGFTIKRDNGITRDFTLQNGLPMEIVQKADMIYKNCMRNHSCNCHHHAQSSASLAPPLHGRIAPHISPAFSEPSSLRASTCNSADSTPYSTPPISRKTRPQEGVDPDQLREELARTQWDLERRNPRQSFDPEQVVRRSNNDGTSSSSSPRSVGSDEPIQIPYPPEPTPRDLQSILTEMQGLLEGLNIDDLPQDEIARSIERLKALLHAAKAFSGSVTEMIGLLKQFQNLNTPLPTQQDIPNQTRKDLPNQAAIQAFDDAIQQFLADERQRAEREAADAARAAEQARLEQERQEKLAAEQEAERRAQEAAAAAAAAERTRIEQEAARRAAEDATAAQSSSSSSSSSMSPRLSTSQDNALAGDAVGVVGEVMTALADMGRPKLLIPKGFESTLRDNQKLLDVETITFRQSGNSSRHMIATYANGTECTVTKLSDTKHLILVNSTPEKASLLDSRHTPEKAWSENLPKHFEFFRNMSRELQTILPGLRSDNQQERDTALRKIPGILCPVDPVTKKAKGPAWWATGLLACEYLLNEERLKSRTHKEAQEYDRTRNPDLLHAKETDQLLKGWGKTVTELKHNLRELFTLVEFETTD